MRRIRFETMNDVFEAYPGLKEMVAVAPGPEAPIPFLERLVRTGAIDDAVTLAAFVLPRREAVWWACRCVAAASKPMSSDDRRRWELAAAWVHRPEDRRRVAAFEAASALDGRTAIAVLLNAVVWSGGAMDPTSQHSAPAPADLAGKAARNAVLLTAAGEPTEARPTFLERCVSTALAIGREEGDLAEEVLKVVRG